ncbi:MFS general substrate transporter [Karstenula rhodostoma CBS 690.94]|uniref:MFS general substrate transporter n=1 Tax=Karstenula rhodostoma CBS 690.94 TaxID=1392251 RepID=A0A9P4PTB3_9PLEO|nr:MFS general substrate transporter [Karstenula rhodostoma CBS 690.94]
MPIPRYTNVQWLLICVAVYSSALLYGLDTTIVAVLQGPIISRFDDIDKLGWLGIGFPLGSIAMIAAWSKAYGVFDTKWMYIGSLVHFAAGSSFCGAAPNMNSLIVGRLNIWTHNTSLEKRSWYISGGGVTWSLGRIIGPLIGGAFADSSATWRWAFYLNLVLFGVFTPVYFLVLNSHVPQPGILLITRLKEFDWLGITLNTEMYTAFVISFAIGGTLWPWSDGRTIGIIVAFAVTPVAFIIQQKFTILTTEEHRIFPVRFLAKRSFILLYIAQSSLPTALANLLWAPPGFLLPKYGLYMTWYMGSGVLNVIGGALFFGLLTPQTSVGAIYGFSILLALGTGLAQQIAYSIASARAPEQLSDAMGFINSAQVGSVVLALTFTSLIFQNVGHHNVKQALVLQHVDNADIRAALGGAQGRLFDQGFASEQVQLEFEAGIVDALRWSFVTVLIAGVLETIAALCMKRERLFVQDEAKKEQSAKEKSVEVKE